MSSAENQATAEENYYQIADNECLPNGKKTIECLICGEQLTKIYKLRQHMQAHAAGIDAKILEAAPIYSYLNPHKRSIETAVLSNFIVNEIQAKRCSQFYVILTEHGTELHISDSETEVEEDAADSVLLSRHNYKCVICKGQLDRRFKALQHQRAVHGQQRLPFACDFCNHSYIDLQLLIHHLKTKCENDEKPTSCLERLKQYLLKDNLEQFNNLTHARRELKQQRLVTAAKIYSCDVCQKEFARSEHLTRHKAVHLPENQKFECPVCYRRFNRKDNLQSHLKVHMNEAARESEKDSSHSPTPILCQYCGHWFNTKSNYVVHMRRHTGEKPFKCDSCSKAFAKSTDLHTHQITHTKEKKFSCEICGKTFSKPFLVSKHLRTHAGPFHCNFCSKSFRKPNELATHLRAHANGEIAKECAKETEVLHA